MTRLSVSIMAHPSRALWVQELWNAIGPVPTAWDEKRDEWDTGRRAWELHNPNADWHLVLQDDVLVTADLLSRTTELLTGLEHNGPVSLYLGAGRPMQPRVLQAIEQQRDGWVTLPWLIWGPAIVLPTRHIGQVLELGDQYTYGYDKRLAQYHKQRHIPCLHTWPSLVDHRDQGSLLGHDRPGQPPRRAHQWIGNAQPTPQ
jgi:hypothetical protein